jgi:hypothetical protein
VRQLVPSNPKRPDGRCLTAKRKAEPFGPAFIITKNV